MYSNRIVYPNILQEYYKFDAIWLSTYVKVVYLLLDTCTVDEVLAKTHVTLHDMVIARKPPR